MRSTSGTGTLRPSPNMRPARDLLGHLVDGRGRVDVLGAERLAAARARRGARRGCGRRGCRCRRRRRRGRARRGSARGRAVDRLERLVPGRLDAARRRAGPAASVSRSGSSCSCLRPCAFGQRKPWLRTSSSSPRTDDHLASARRDLESAGRFAERTGAVVERPCAQTTPAAARSRALARRTAAARRSRTGRRRRGACARRRRAATTTIAWRSPTIDRAAEPRRQPGRAPSAGRSAKLATGALVGQSSAAQTHSGRTWPVPSSSDSSGVQSAANMPSSQRRRGTAAARPPAPGRGRRRSRWGRGGGRTSVAARRRRRRRLVGRRRGRARRAAARRARPRPRGRRRRAADALAVAHDRSGRSIGGGRRSETVASSAPTSPATTPAGVAAVGRPGGPLKRDGMISDSLTPAQASQARL